MWCRHPYAAPPEFSSACLRVNGLTVGCKDPRWASVSSPPQRMSLKHLVALQETHTHTHTYSPREHQRQPVPRPPSFGINGTYVAQKASTPGDVSHPPANFLVNSICHWFACSRRASLRRHSRRNRSPHLRRPFSPLIRYNAELSIMQARRRSVCCRRERLLAGAFLKFRFQARTLTWSSLWVAFISCLRFLCCLPVRGRCAGF